MKALYCLPKCEVNSQVSLLFLVCKTIVRLNSLDFLIQVLRKKPLVMRKMRYTHGFAWILWILLFSGLFLYNNHNLFKSLIQNHFFHQITYCHTYCIIAYCIICISYNLYICTICIISWSICLVIHHLRFDFILCLVMFSLPESQFKVHRWSSVVTNYDRSNLSSFKSASFYIRKNSNLASTCL